MAGVIPLSARHQFSDASGAPLVGGTVDVYLAGTTTRTTTWQDKTQVTENTNPIVLDASGGCTIYCNPALTYKFVVKDVNGVTQSHLGGDNILVGGETPTIATIAVDRFSGTGAQTQFTLSVTPTSENNTMVYVAGVYIQKNAYSVSGTTLTFAVAPASGTNNIEVQTIDQTDYSAVSTAIATVEANIANINTVAGISANVTTVAGISANVTTVAGISANVTTVAGISANVTTVAGVSADVTTVATDIADVSTVADNITTVAQAVAAARIYPDTTAGLAAVASGEYFYVPSAISNESLILYKDNAGVAEEVKRLPSSAMYTAFGTLVGTGNQIVLVSEYGKIALAVKDDGGIEVGELTGATLIATEFQNDEGDSIASLTPTGYVYAVADGTPSGKMALGVKTDGTAVAEDLEVTTINGINFDTLAASASAPASAATERNYDAEIAMVLSYGQSLAVGTEATPPHTTAQRFDNLKFAGGVRSQDSGTPYTSLVPLTETLLSTEGETPIGGATDQIKELILSEDGLAYTDHTYQLLGSAPGQGGTTISQLSSGAIYDRFVDDVTNGYALAQAAGKVFKVPAFFWTQGETDYTFSTPAATYKTALVTLRNNLDAEVKAITGQLEDVACISYQTQCHGSFGHSNNPYIAIAQYQVMKENANHYVACPLYWGSEVHQSAANSKKLGAYYGIAYKRIVIDGDTSWRPLMPISTNRQGTLLLVRFNVPRGELTLDTVLHTAQTNSGFTLVDSGGVAITISSVAITGPDTVKVTAATTIPAGAKLRYGWGNGTAGGNLRDSQGDFIVFNGGGLDIPMHNWCVIFEETIA
jgi:hypothetical protein